MPVARSTPRHLTAAATQATFAAFLFAGGAVLNAISRGIENGHGYVGLNFDPPRAPVQVQVNLTVTAAELETAEGRASAEDAEDLDNAFYPVGTVYNGTNQVLTYRTSYTQDSTDTFFNAYMQDLRAHERWYNRRKAQATMVFGHFASII